MVEPAGPRPDAACVLQLSAASLTLVRGGDAALLKRNYAPDWRVSAPTHPGQQRAAGGPLFLLQLGPSENLELEFKDRRWAICSV